ncbi:hypothetical protein Tco_0209925 [Tanacetum coccineum]
MPIDKTCLGLLVLGVGHSLHFDRPEFALIIGLPFGTVNFGLYTSGELKFHNRVFPHNLRLSVTNLDVIGVIEDEETFWKLCDRDSIRLCLILALEVIFMGRLLTCLVDDTLFRLVENLEDWNCFPWGEHIWTHLYDEIKNVIEKHSDEHCFRMKKDCMFGSLSHLKDLEKSRKRAHSSFRVSSSVCMTNIISPKKWLKDEVICELNVRVFKLETIIQVLARERNEEYWVLHFNDEFSSLGREFMDSLNILFQDLIQPHYSDEDISNDFVIEDELRLCLEDEERMLLEHEKNIIEEKRFRVEEAKRMSILGKLTHSKTNHVDIVPGKTNPTHIDLWVDYMWHGRPDNANWAMVICYFVQILLQNSTPLVYANGDKYATLWSDVDQGCKETYVTCQEFNVHCQERREQMIEMQSFLHVSTLLVDSYNLLKDLQDYELEKCRELMKSISETQL